MGSAAKKSIFGCNVNLCEAITIRRSFGFPRRFLPGKERRDSGRERNTMMQQPIPISLHEWNEVKKRHPYYLKGWVLLRAPKFEPNSSVAWVWARLVSW